jgi:hypothetical protein
MKEPYLLKALLKASHSPHSKILESLLKAVSSTIPSKMCTLWKVNNLANTLSILAREDYKPSPEKEYEFVYPIQGSLTGYLMEQMTPKKPYFKIDSIYDEPYWSLHKSQERVKKFDLKKMVCISIPNSEGIAQKKEPLIIKDLANIDETNLDKNYEHKWLEDTEHVGKSFMGIPIMSPSRPNELLGVIRFTNRLNFRAPVVDFFCNKDLTLVKHVCNLIALYMEYEQSERVRTAFAKQMAHEEKTNVRGLGLGLTVVKQILEDFWCHIWISNFKKPTKFEIFLPDRLCNDSYLKTNEWQME